uniref:Golgi apparatus protein 1 n=1 Tax=Salmo trutta TaxID=8032 RepID=A0A674CYB0_SALTR
MKRAGVPNILSPQCISRYILEMGGGRLQTETPSSNGNGLSNQPANPPVPVNIIIGAPGQVAPAAVAAMTQPRRATGWKLAEEQSCWDDLTRLCPKHTWSNNLAVLECLQDRKEGKTGFGWWRRETEIAVDCNHLLWNYKLNLTMDPKFESVAMEICRSTITEIKECSEEERGKGYLVSCLVDHRGNITEYQCHQYVTKMTSVVFSDYRLICGFMDQCREDINALRCGSINVGEKLSAWGSEGSAFVSLYQLSAWGSEGSVFVSRVPVPAVRGDSPEGDGFVMEGLRITYF